MGEFFSGGEILFGGGRVEKHPTLSDVLKLLSRVATVVLEQIFNAICFTCMCLHKLIVKTLLEVCLIFFAFDLFHLLLPSRLPEVKC